MLLPGSHPQSSRHPPHQATAFMTSHLLSRVPLIGCAHVPGFPLPLGAAPWVSSVSSPALRSCTGSPAAVRPSCRLAHSRLSSSLGWGRGLGNQQAHPSGWPSLPRCAALRSLSGHTPSVLACLRLRLFLLLRPVLPPPDPSPQSVSVARGALGLQPLLFTPTPAARTPLLSVHAHAADPMLKGRFKNKSAMFCPH